MSQGHEIKSTCLKQGNEERLLSQTGLGFEGLGGTPLPKLSFECPRPEVSALLCLLLFGTLRPHISAVLRVTVYQENEKE